MNCKLKIKIGRDDNYAFGPGVKELLMAIDEYGSIRKAAMSMELSYSKALHILNRSEEAFKRELVSRVTGGAGGGKAILTEDGRKIVELYSLFESKLKKEADILFDEIFGDYLSVVE